MHSPKIYYKVLKQHSGNIKYGWVFMIFCNDIKDCREFLGQQFGLGEGLLENYLNLLNVAHFDSLNPNLLINLKLVEDLQKSNFNGTLTRMKFIEEKKWNFIPGE